MGQTWPRAGPIWAEVWHCRLESMLNRHARKVLSGLTILGVGVAGTLIFTRPDSGPTQRAALTAADPAALPSVQVQPGLQAALATAPKVVQLHAATAPPVAEPAALTQSPTVKPHEVFSFLPYWTLADVAASSLADASTVAYFSLDVNADGSVDRSGPGWEGFTSAELVNAVNQAHSDGDRVVLSVTCFSQASLDAITHSSTAATRLASDLSSLVAGEQMDGVNFDFEGIGSADRAGLVSLISEATARLRQVDPHWQITIDTYASAVDGGGFFDAQALAPVVDAIFVMAYDMNDRNTPSPTAPLTGPGYTDDSVVSSWSSQIPADKVILGIPFYGYAWPTAGPALGAAATGSEFPLSYSQIETSGHPVYWDSMTDNPWTSWQSDSQWYQAFFDDSTSIAMKASAASADGLLGVGIWALGMQGSDAAVLTAIEGGQAPAKSYIPSPEPAVSPATGTVVASAAPTASAHYSPGVNVSEPTPPAIGATTPSGRPGPAPAVGLCSLLSSDAPMLATAAEAAGQESGRSLGVDMTTVARQMAASAGCNGSAPVAVPGGQPPSGVCALLSGQANLAALLDNESGSHASLGGLVQRLAASAGCRSVTFDPYAPGAGCSAFDAALSAVGGEAAGAQSFVEQRTGNTLGVDISSAVSGLGVACSAAGPSAAPSTELPMVCTLLADVSEWAQTLQTVAGISGQLSTGVAQLSAPVGCP